MKRLYSLLTVLALLLGLCACGGNLPAAQASWQEQYDLGVRYLSEGNYQEAILAFDAAIEIDPRQAPVYVGRGDAYVLLAETEENLAAALADYGMALELDEGLAAAYLGLADVYIRQGDYEAALAILREGLERAEDRQAIADKLAEMEAGIFADSADRVRRENTYDAQGNLVGYSDYDYDERSRRCSWRNYNADGTGGFYLDNSCEVTFNSLDQPEKYQFYDGGGSPLGYDSMVYNDLGQRTEQWRYEMDGTEVLHFLYYYDERGLQVRYEACAPDGGLYNYWISEYDGEGNLLRQICYDGATDEPVGYVYPE